MEINALINKPQSNINTNKKRVIAASIAGSALGIGAAVAGVYAMAKGRNPMTTLRNLTYAEGDVLLIGAGSVLGGLIGGAVCDNNKKNLKPKLREASQQFIGNMVFPISILAGANKLLNKFVIKSMENLSARDIVIKTAVCIASLVGGMELGNAVMNRVNNKIFKEKVKHDVHAEDYLVHADDLCLTANMVLKDFKQISAVTSKILPLTFIVAGSKTGMQQSEKSINL